MTAPVIKPTRREILKAVLDAAAAKRQEEAKASNEHGRKLHQDAQAANAKMRDIAQTYGDTKYKALLKKLQKTLGTEFPEANIYFTIDVEKQSNLSSKFKADGKITARLVVHNCEKHIVDLPKEVLNEMAEANNESERLYADYLESVKETERLNRAARRYGSSDTADYQRLLQTIVPTLGEEAAPHLDALISLVEKAMTAPAA